VYYAPSYTLFGVKNLHKKVGARKQHSHSDLFYSRLTFVAATPTTQGGAICFGIGGTCQPETRRLVTGRSIPHPWPGQVALRSLAPQAHHRAQGLHNRRASRLSLCLSRTHSNTVIWPICATISPHLAVVNAYIAERHHAMRCRVAPGGPHGPIYASTGSLAMTLYGATE